MPDSLKSSCVPRQSVFDRARRDVVLDLGDFLSGKLDEQAGARFYDENFVTAGMKLLITKAFDRLQGRRDQSATFLLSQAMGGGKTHSMLALGLLARYPSLRSRLGGDFHLGTAPIRVIGFDGRQSDYPFGLWGALAEQVGKKDLFAALYSPLQAPGVSSWINLLKGEPTIILLDELPPYFNQALGKAIGASNLAEITTTALSNLFVAANKEELSNIVIVISDLSSTAYTSSSGSVGINSALDNLKSETGRSALPIEPVATQGDEVYHILRTRLFTKLPDLFVRERVAVSYAEVVKKAKQMDLTAANPETYVTELRESYPFHFSLRDLYGRFKANPGFQQTRGLLRMMRVVVATLWEKGAADSISLIHPYDIDLNDPDTYSEFSTINPSLNEAVRLDIANNGASHAEELDRKLGGTQAQDVAKLIYVASLANIPGALTGLQGTEVIAWLCRPDRDIARIRTDVLEQLPNEAWYLHLSNDGRLYFKNVRNLAAQLHSMVGGYNRENKVRELRSYLEELFKPNLRDVYQECRVLPSWEEVNISSDKVTLIVTEPYAKANHEHLLHPEWLSFYEQVEYKNRMLFLSGDRDTLEDVLKNAALYRAINAIIKEQDTEELPARDPQRLEAQKSLDKIRLGLRSAVQQTFSLVIFPSSGGLRSETIRLDFENNNYDAERQIKQTLIGVQKFTEEAPSENLIEKIRGRLFDGQNPVIWAEVKKRAAIKSTWQLHHPRLLDDAKTEALRRGIWREEGQGSVRCGPFPRQATSVHVRLKNRDETTGKAILEIQPIGGTKVVYEIGGGIPTAASEPVPDYSAFETGELIVKFLCIDEGTTPAPNGDPVVWNNRITLRNRVFSQGADSFCELIAVPEADIFYTTDGSDPKARGVPYAGAFPLPPATRIVQAYATKHGIESDIMRRDIEAGKEKRELDPNKALVWKTHHRYLNCQTVEAYQLLSRLVQFKARAEKIELYYYFPDGGEELHYIASEPAMKSGDELLGILNHIAELQPQGNVNLSIQRIHFERAQDFLDWKNEDKIAVQDSEISQ